ncbi:MAG: tryptophan synthase subunit beta [Spirochaetaceae bacterium]
MKKYNNFFGRFGGRYVAEVLRAPLQELEDAYKKYINDEDFIKQLAQFSKEFIGRPTPLLFAENSTKELGGAQIYIKLEGLANTGAHKINNAVGQALLAKKMGKTRIIAETGAGQHGVATAAACARFGLECIVYMGAEDIKRQHPNVYWMELYGAKVISVESGAKTLKDAVNEALRDWSGSFNDTHYIIGSALGPSPYPDMVREFQSVIGKEVKDQASELDIAAMVACVGGGSNAIGFFEPFLEQKEPRLIGVEAGGRGSGLGENAIRMTDSGRDGIVQGYKSKFLVDNDGQLCETHSISAGLDYPGIGPQLADYGEMGRIEFTSADNNEAIEALKFFARNEGVIFAMESAHAGAAAMKLAKELPKDKSIIINMSGRGDKDIFISAKVIDEKPWKEFLKEESK